MTNLPFRNNSTVLLIIKIYKFVTCSCASGARVANRPSTAHMAPDAPRENPLALPNPTLAIELAKQETTAELK